jgi:hypothetical protein
VLASTDGGVQLDNIIVGDEWIGVFQIRWNGSEKFIRDIFSPFIHFPGDPKE